ncbi:MAG: ABC transporter permease [Rectinemataceae bacterium]
MAETSRAPRTHESHGSRRSPVGGKFAGLAITLAASFAAAILLLLIFAEDFPTALRLFFLSPFGNKYYFGNMLASTVPLMLAGLGVSLAFASRNFNLGGEGQVYAGGLAAVVVCLMMPDAPPGIVQILAALAGAAAGGGIGSVSGALKRSLGVDELISSFLISASVVLIVDYLITGPFQDQSSNFQTTMAIAPALRFARIMQPSSLSTGIFLGLAICLLAKLTLDRTRFGYELRVFGSNGEFAKYCGIDTGLYTLLPMGLSGALHGLAGAAMIMGSYYKAMKGFSGGVGWSAISVALIAHNNPLAVIPSAFFLAYLEAGAKSVMVGSNVSSEIVAVVQSVIFFLITAKITEKLVGPSRRRAKKKTEAGTGRTATRQEEAQR